MFVQSLHVCLHKQNKRSQNCVFIIFEHNEFRSFKNVCSILAECLDILFIVYCVMHDFYHPFSIDSAFADVVYWYKLWKAIFFKKNSWTTFCFFVFDVKFILTMILAFSKEQKWEKFGCIRNTFSFVKSVAHKLNLQTEVLWGQS